MHQLNLALSSFLDGIRSFRNPAFLVPLLAYTLLQLLVLSVLLIWHLPFWSGFFSTVLGNIPLIGEGVLHYPNFYALLPAVFGLVNFILIATVGAYLWGVAVVAVANSFGMKAGPPWSTARRHLGSLILATFPLIGLGLLAFFGMPALLQKFQLSGYALLATRYGLQPAYNILAQSLFLFVPMAILLEGKGPFAAIGRSLSLWKSNMIGVVFLVGLVAVWHLGTNWFFNHTSQFMTQFRPELVAGVLGGDLVLSFFTDAVLVGAATAMFMSRRSEAS